MRGRGRGKHPPRALSLAVKAVSEWAQGMRHDEIPSLEQQLRLRDIVAGKCTLAMRRPDPEEAKQ